MSVMTAGIAEKSSRHRTHGGFSMVEVLVALVVLGVGMLGIASLYVVTLRSSGSAISRMQAVNLAGDLGDRIRANRNAGEAYEGTAAANGDGCSGSTTSCSATVMAAHDLFVWRTQLQTALPGATATVDVSTATTPSTYTITIRWREPGDNADLQYDLRMQI